MDNCIFCRITKNELPSYKIYEDDYFFAILDIKPYAKGHTILICKQHCETVFDLSVEVAKQSYVAVKNVSELLKNAVNFDGVNVMQNNGKASGQSVSHFHIHLIPRFNDDTINFIQETTDFQKEEFIELQNIIINRS